MADAVKPVLWHIPVSHYSEKVRWALDYKGVDHERRAPQPHVPVALALTRGKHATFPVLQIDGRTIGDSNAIIAALEERHPDPPLYPADSQQRRRALDLEEWFDEEVGPHVRLLAWHEVTRHRPSLNDIGSRLAPAPLNRFRSLGGAVMRSFANIRYGVHSESAAQTARMRVHAAFDRLEQELGDRDHLVGDSFSVADLTAAALLYPLVTPPEAPHLLDRLPEALEQFRAPLKDRRGFRWVEDTFARHRREPAGWSPRASAERGGAAG